MGPECHHKYLLRKMRRRFDPNTQRRKYYEDRSMTQKMALKVEITEVSTSQEMLGATGNRVKEEILLEETSGESTVLRTPQFQLSGCFFRLSNCERRCFRCFKPPGL